MANEKLKKSDKEIVLFIIGMTLLLVIRDLLSVSYSKWMLVAFGCIFAYMFTVENIIYAICFMLPLSCGIPGKYLYFVFFMAMIIKKKRIKPVLLMFLLYWIAKEIVATFWVNNPDLIGIMGYFVHIVLLFTLIYDTSVLNYKKSIDIYLIGTVVLCVIIMVRTIITAPSNWLWLFSNGWFRFGMASEATLGMVLQLNANSLAYYCIVGIACGMLAIISEFGTSKIIGITSVILCTITGILTASRSFLIVMAIVLILTFIAMPKKKSVVFLCFMVLVGMILAGIALAQRYPELIEGLIARLTDGNVLTGGGRLALFKSYIDAFLLKPRLLFTGTGVVHYKQITGIYNSMHNATEQIVICYGVIGAIVFLIGILRPAWRSMRINSSRKLIQLIPMIAVLLFVQTIQFINPEMLMLPYIIAVYALRIGSNIDEEVYYNS